MEGGAFSVPESRRRAGSFQSRGTTRPMTRIPPPLEEHLRSHDHSSYPRGGTACSILCAGLRRSQTGTEAGNAIKILLQWAKWNWCRRAYITVMPKRGKKGAVVEDAEEPKAEPEAKKSKAGAKKNEKEAVGEGAVLYEDPPDQKTSPSGKSATLKICSWNVDGLRAWIKKKGLDWVKEEAPDILCLQETKCSENKLPVELQELSGLSHQYWSAPSDKEGYSGVGLLSRQCPLKVSYGIGEEEHDQEGRVIVAEYDAFVLVTAYVPNAGRGLVRLEYRQRWDEAFRKFLKGLASRKPLVLCGDLNVAHEEIDLRNPKGNKKNAGFTPQERQGFGELLQAVPLTDSFRHLYPNTAYAYTFWTYMMNARSKNVGWRLDYFLLSQSLLPALCDSKIRSKALGSDHCPITLYLAL
nr:DNA-(apurinic or apyrimidinic site) lyase isoform X2 [Odocoileus virginianus texanus]